MEKKTHFNIWYVLFAVIVILVLQSLLFRQQVETITYSELLKKVQAGEIQSVEISDQRIVAAEKSRSEGERSKIYATVRVQDETLIELLKQKDVNITGRIENPWFRNLLSWIMPLIILYLIWTFLFRRLGQGLGGGVMTFGKNKAKIYGKKEGDGEDGRF